MQYLLAIIGAIIGAGLAATFVGMPVANWGVSLQSFNSPVAADDMHGWIFLACLLGGLVLGWSLGWGLGSRIKVETPEL